MEITLVFEEYTPGRQSLLRPDGNLSKQCEERPGGRRGWSIFRPELQKRLKLVDGSPFDKYMEEIGADYKTHGGKPSPLKA